MIEPIKDTLGALVAATTTSILQNLSLVPLREREVVKLRGEGLDPGFESETELQPDFGKYLYIHSKDLRRSPEFQDLLEKIEDSPALAHALRLPADSEARADALLLKYLCPLVCEVVTGVNKGRVMDDVLAQALASLDGFIQSDTFKVQVTAPLLHFTSALTDVEIHQSVYLRKISEAELVSLLEERLNSKLIDTDIHQIRRLEYQLEKAEERPRKDHELYPSDDNSERLFDRILQAMRLAGDGAVGLLFTRSLSIGFLGPSVGTSYIPARWAKYTYGKGYGLTAERLAATRTLIVQLEKLEQNHAFALAVRRLNATYYRPLGVMAVDRLIDSWVGLEALLLPGGNEGELQFKASLRLAHLIGDPSNRLEVFNRARKSYQLRSKAVHGKLVKLENEIAEEAEDFLRQALRKCAKLGFVPTREWFDSQALGETSAAST